jgi:hypothetical protein
MNKPTLKDIKNLRKAAALLRGNPVLNAENAFETPQGSLATDYAPGFRVCGVGALAVCDATWALSDLSKMVGGITKILKTEGANFLASKFYAFADEVEAEIKEQNHG